MLGIRQRKDTLFRYLAIVWFRAAMPRQALWRVGARAKVSDTYSREVDPRARVVRGEQVYDREMLSILTSRAFATNIAPTVSFNHGIGEQRLLKACLGFVELQLGEA
jgi:hypothetical protein